MKFVQGDNFRCSGARECEKACSRTFFKVEDPRLSAIRITKTETGFDINVCNQCGECIAVCPTQALYRNPAGTVMIKKDRCVGCLMCVAFCPTHSMHIADGQKIPFKCVACGACIKACPSGAIAMVEADHSRLPA